jgi:ribosome-associated protein
MKNIRMKNRANEPSPSTGREPVWTVVEAAREKKAQDIVLLEMKEVSGFTDHFVVCHGSSNRQVQAISDEVFRRLSLSGLRPTHIEGYNHGEWVLMDYSDFVVHIFSEKARSFYDLERLWRTAHRVAIEEE